MVIIKFIKKMKTIILRIKPRRITKIKLLITLKIIQVVIKIDNMIIIEDMIIRAVIIKIKKSISLLKSQLKKLQNIISHNNNSNNK